MKVYKFWAQPMSAHDNALLCTQLRLAADYRRELATMENLARTLKRGLEQRVPPDARPNWRKQDEYKETMRKIGDEQAEAVRRARGRAVERGLYWGTYLQVEEAIEQARRTTKFWDDIRVFAPYDEGRVCVQIQKTKPLVASELVGSRDTRVQIEPLLYALGPRDEQHFASIGQPGVVNHAGVRRPERMRTMRIRVGSTTPREPIWARLHLNTFHGRGRKRHDRWLDAGNAQVKWVFVQRVRTGMMYRWAAIFIVDQDSVATKPEGRCRGTTIAFDLGWRRVDGGMRLAYWKDDRGAHGQLVIPDNVISRSGKSDELRSTRDDLRNSESAWLKAWIDEHVPAMPSGIDTPPPTDAMEPRAPSIATAPDRTVDIVTTLCESAVHMLSWRRMSRFERLYRAWKDNRFLGDAAGFDRFESWLKRDRFLYQWETHNRRRMVFQISGRVDEFVAAACKRYETVIVEKFDLNEMKERPTDVTIATDEETRMRMINARQIQKLAPGRMRESIERFAKKYQCQLVKVPAANTTKRCSSCGHVRGPSEDGAELDIACPSCRVVKDQDLNAAENLLTLGAVQLQNEVTHEGPTTKLKLAARRTRKKIARARALEAE